MRGANSYGKITFQWHSMYRTSVRT